MRPLAMETTETLHRGEEIRGNGREKDLGHDGHVWRTDEGKKFQRKGRLLDIYGQCVYDPHHKVFVAMKKGYGSDTITMLLNPDFSNIKWRTP